MLRATLVLYILKAMLSWVPLANHTAPVSPEHTLARYTSIAEDIADVVMDPTEAAVLPGQTGDKGIVGNGLLLAAIASLEGAYQEYVDDGSCNDTKWRNAHADILRMGGCDGGHAWTIWQIHTMGGLVLTGQYVTGYMYVEDVRLHLETIITGLKMIKDRKLGARTALHILRLSMRDHHSLCAYTGESCSGMMPLAVTRLQRPIRYMAANPYIEVTDLPAQP